MCSSRTNEGVLQMKSLSYLFVLLLISAQIDDFWAASPVLASAPMADDDDEYLPSQRRPQEEESSSRQKPAFVGLAPRTIGVSVVQRGVPSEWNPTMPLTPALLYLSMFLQI